MKRFNARSPEARVIKPNPNKDFVPPPSKSKSEKAKFIILFYEPTP